MEPTPKVQKYPTKRNDEKLPSIWSILLIVYFCIILGLSFTAFVSMPYDLYFPDNSEEFSGFKAKYELAQLVSFGPRVVGSIANEVKTVDFLKNQIQSIISESNGLYTIETDVQIVSGVYKAKGRTNVYDSVQNVIVKLTPLNSTQKNALLINSHFDTAPTSPGAGDDGAMVAVMLRILRALTRSKKAVRHPLIFLFNGDEENGLEASHGFMNQHKWAKEAKAAVNLEGMGVGGKELLYESGPQDIWLLKYYGQAAKHPFASVIGQELFEKRLIPVFIDTDLRMFYEYGNITGLNFANINNGYYYHTHLDKLSYVDDGSLQHTGDNILPLIRTLANAEELDDNYVSKPTGNGIYFDIMGLYFASYSEATGRIINVSIAGVSLVLIGISVLLMNFKSQSSLCDIITQFILTFVIQLITISLGAAVTVAIAIFVDFIDYSMAWFSHPWMIFGLYFCPFMFVQGIIPAVVLSCRKFTNLELNFSISLFLHAQCVILVTIIFAMTALEIRSAFVVTNVVLFYALALLINLVFGLYRKLHAWIVPIILGQSISFAFTSYMMQILYTVFIPIQGRQSGNTTNPELIIGLSAIMISFLMFGLILPIFSIFRHGKTIMSGALLIFVLFFILLFTNICFPFTPNTPQKQKVSHTLRTIHNMNGETTYQDAIFPMLLLDRHTTRTLQDVATRNGLKIYSWQNDPKELHYYQRLFNLVKAPRFEIPNKSKLILISREEVQGDIATDRFNFQITGSAKTYTILITPLNGTTMIDWSFRLKDEPIPMEQKEFYLLNIQLGKSSTPYNFWITVKVKSASDAVLSFSFHSEYQYKENESRAELDKFIQTFPAWTVVNGHVASLDSYVF